MLSDRKYLLEFGCALLGYLIITHFSILFLKGNPDSSWRIPIALTPIIPLVFALIAVLRGIRRMDEMQSRINFEAVTFAFCTAILVSISYGFLENVGFPSVNWIWGGVGMIALWGIGLMFARRRYV